MAETRSAWLGFFLLAGLSMSKRVTGARKNASSMNLATDLQVSFEDTASEAERPWWPWDSGPEEITSPVDKLIGETKSAGKPRIYRASSESCAGGSYRGIVVYFHGYSASPAQIDLVAPKLLKACFDVFVPMLPGHGEHMVDNCEDSGKCTVQIDGNKGFDLSELPTHGQTYRDFAKQMGDLVAGELKYREKILQVPAGKAQLMLLGLSLGSSLAYAASKVHPGRFSRMMLLNPFFGSGTEAIDLKILDCMHTGKNNSECAAATHAEWLQEYGTNASGGIVGYALNHDFFTGKTPGEVQAAVMTDLQRFSDWLPSFLNSQVSLMNTKVVWGANCWQIEEQGKRGEAGGFCAFQQKHVLAAHAFAIDLLSEAVPSSAPPITQILTTARDGITRNGLTYSLAGRLRAKAPNGDGVSMCMFPFSAGTNVHDNGQYWSDDHSMPHANMGNAHGWWEPQLSDNIVSFFHGDTQNVGKELVPDLLIQQAAAGGRREICMDLPLTWGSHRQLRDLVLPEADPAWASSTPWVDPPSVPPPRPQPQPVPKPPKIPEDSHPDSHEHEKKTPSDPDGHEKNDKPADAHEHKDSPSDAHEHQGQPSDAHEDGKKDSPSDAPKDDGVPLCKEMEHFQRGWDVCHLGQTNCGTFACAGSNEAQIWQCNTGRNPHHHCPHGFTLCGWGSCEGTLQASRDFSPRPVLGMCAFIGSMLISL